MSQNRTLAIGFTVCGVPLALVDLTLLRNAVLLLLSSVSAINALAVTVFLLLLAPPSIGAVLLARLWRRPMSQGCAAQHGVGAVLLLAAPPVILFGGMLITLIITFGW